MHLPIFINDLTLSFAEKTCFESFSTRIYSGEKIAIIGKNGAGKSSLLKLIAGLSLPTSGSITGTNDLTLAYVEQTIDDYQQLSGGQRFNRQLSKALAMTPDVLLLDEPTNHLDQKNRNSLIAMLNRSSATLIVASHDEQLLRSGFTTFWHVDNGQITVFNGSFDNYLATIEKQQQSLQQEIKSLKNKKAAQHEKLMQEQQRAAASRQKGKKNIKQRKWPTVVSDAKAHRAEKTSGKKKASIDYEKTELTNRLASLHQPKISQVKFHLEGKVNPNSCLLTISDGCIAYQKQKPLLSNINITLLNQQRLAISGCNGSGKSSLLKAILNDPSISRGGRWLTPQADKIGYLDQHYRNLDPSLSVIEQLTSVRQDWNNEQLRNHLNDFLFSKNSQVQCLVGSLSGGEKARLSLCLIAARTPALLILDEISNNLDRETKQHVSDVLAKFPASMIVVSHEEDFVRSLNIDLEYDLDKLI